ncbi:hypothetical protein V1478_012350 [Vespula squamosa]|uniref:Uncharacterized protein n=1 Tax=Vespula squamosa TaxID=30214 RepID=A0ABD2ACY7_VESSQ
MDGQERNEKHKSNTDPFFEVERQENNATVTIAKENTECEKNHKYTCASILLIRDFRRMKLCICTRYWSRKDVERLKVDQTMATTATTTTKTTTGLRI